LHLQSIYDLGAKGLPFTIAGGDIEEKAVLRIPYSTHED
jgi:hypothetical protein